MNNGDQPAFPDTMRGAEQSIMNQSPCELPTGLTKREYFAIAAMQGLIAGDALGTNTEHVVATSIKFADELIKQLES